MAFIPRLQNGEPTTDNKWYISTQSGGYNPCIEVSGGSVLPNCFTGDTKIVTKAGVKRLIDLVNQIVEIPTMDGEWHEATIRHFGRQQIWKVVLSNGTVYKCTKNHRWLIFNSNGNRSTYEFVDTIDLKHGMIIHNYNNLDEVSVMLVIPTHAINDVYCAVEPITHTMTLGNGELTGNCVGYAWGRYSEIANKSASKLPQSDAYRWLDDAKANGLATGKTPKLGAVIVWESSTKPQWGHVAIVEKLNADGSIEVSESYWGGRRYHSGTVYPPYNTDMKFLGFIYNSDVSTKNLADDFIKTAKSHVGDTIDWTAEKTGIQKNQGWSTAFIMAVAQSVGGLIGNVFYKSYSASTLVKESLKRNYGTYERGYYWGNHASPKVGDIIFFRLKNISEYNNISDEYYADKTGILVDIVDDTLYVVEGQSSQGNNSVVAIRTYNISSTRTILGYYHPDWSLVNASVDNTVIPTFDTTPFDRNDAKIREVGYVRNNSISLLSSDIRLSMINASDIGNMLSKYTNIYSGMTFDDLPNNASIVGEFLAKRNLQLPAIVGILSTIDCITQFRTNYTLYSGKFPIGICSWIDTRKDKMKSIVTDWQSNLSGQLEFMWLELNSTFSKVLDKISSITDKTKSGCKQAAEVFCKEYLELPIPKDIDSSITNIYSRITQYQESAEDNTSVVAIDGVSTMKRLSGQSVDAGTRTLIPTVLDQTGIIPNYTNYSYWYDKWLYSQRDIADIWNNKGRKSSRHIAVIDNYYLVAVKPIIGKVGDILTFILEDGTNFNALIADVKGSDADNKWGHVFGNQVDIIEWEMVGSYLSASDPETQSKLDLTGWKGKKVSSVINYGTYLDTIQYM